MRLSYIGNVFRYNESGGGKQKEFTQAGVELLGAATPEADAEVVALAVETVLAAGITDFQIDIGQVEFFKGLMEEAGFGDDETEQVRVSIDAKDFIGLERIIGAHSINDRLKEIIMSLPQMFGSSELLKKLGKITRNRRALTAIEYTGEVIGIVDECGLGKYVSVDLGMVQSLDYYTGLIFKGFTRGVGFPILSGGRYDNVIGKFGRDCPAVGFSIGINMIMSALQHQNEGHGNKGQGNEGQGNQGPGDQEDRIVPMLDAILFYDNLELRQKALSLCKELRCKGFSIETDLLGMDIDTLVSYASKKGIAAAVELLDKDNAVALDIYSGDSSMIRLSELEGYLRKVRCGK